jgi:hypothetical protein
MRPGPRTPGSSSPSASTATPTATSSSRPGRLNFAAGSQEVPGGAHRVDYSWVDRPDPDALRRSDSPRRKEWDDKAERRARKKAERKRMRR